LPEFLREELSDAMPPCVREKEEGTKRPENSRGED